MWGSTSIFLFLAIKSMRIIMHLTFPFTNIWGFHCISAGKESACNAGGPGSIPGSGRSAREGTGYPLPYSWASLVAQLVKNPPAMQIRSLGWGDPLETGRSLGDEKSYPLQCPGLENPKHCISMGLQRVGHDWASSTSTVFVIWADRVALQGLE